MRSIRKLVAGMYGCVGKRSLSSSVPRSCTYHVCELEAEESAEEYYKLPSFEDVSCPPWTSKAEVNLRISLENSETT